MSITVADVMKLPSMRGAKVLGGADGLARVVSSISVLEYARPTAIQSELFDRIEFLGNELAITGFMNDPDDVELQCTNLRRLAGIGEVGVILFYVGIVMKKVDRRLIEVANELHFPLICMPVGQMNQRYSEVICEVMELIYRDQMAGTNLVSELLEQAVGLAPHQRTVDSMLRLLADRLHASVVLMDRSRRVLNEAAWPRSLDQAVKDQLSAAEFPVCGSWGWCGELDIHIYRDSIQTWEHHAMDLLIFKEGEALDVVLTRQAVEVVQLTVSIWSDKHDRIVIGELVRAILQDEPMKMRRLADIFHVDIASINSMWIISGDTAGDREKLPDILEAVLRDTQAYSRAAIADIYEEEMVLFIIGPDNMQDVRALTEAVGNELSGRHIRATLTRCHALNTTTRVREAFLSHRVALAAAKRIFPGQWAYTLEQIDFARQCQELIGRGEHAMEEALRCVGALKHGDDGLLETLEHYLLDARMHVTRTADLMFLHKNTIKYRLQRIAERLGFVPGDLPESIPLFTACALERLLRKH